jgi:hypothetical protein
MSTQQYRLLNVGEPIQEGDEFFSEDGSWLQTKCPPGTPIIKGIYRRPLAPTGWIAIKDRKPEFPCLLGTWANNGQWQHGLTSGHVFLGDWTYWASPPPPPPQPDPAEQAWEKYYSPKSKFHASSDYRDAFLAGWKARGE